MLRDRRLLQPEVDDHIAHRPLCQRQIVENLAPPRLGYRIERVGGGCGSGHDRKYIFLYRNMSSAKILKNSLAFLHSVIVNYNTIDRPHILVSPAITQDFRPDPN